MSLVPIKYRDLPLTLVFDLYYKTNYKLNLIRGDSMKLIENEQDFLIPEYHKLRFEG